MVSHTPPKNIRELLRQEVNFGCPVPDCGVPYLTWHHFDPTYSEMEKLLNPQHNPNGIIALCHTHADLADGRRWTPDQLRRMKQSPFVTSDEIREFYDFLRENTVCMIGNIGYNVHNVLEIDGERVIGFEKDSEGYDRLNLLIRNSNGDVILQMENNDWTAFTDEVFDLICPPQGKELQFISKDKKTDFKIRFDEYSEDAFRMMLFKRNFNPDTISDFISSNAIASDVPVWSITGTLVWGMYHLKIEKSSLLEMNRNIRIGVSVVSGRRSVVSINNGEFSFG